MIVTGTLITGSLMAGGLVTNNNQSAAWVRLPARDASTEADAAYFNPAGLMKLDNGLHISVSNQTIFQTREIKSTFPYLNSGDYKGSVSAPIFPSLYAIYKLNKFAFSLGFMPIGGGGGATFNKGLPSFESQVAGLAPGLTASGIPTTSYSVDMYFKGTSVYYSYQANVAYKINDMLSVAIGGRLVTVKNTYNGYLNNIMINPTYPAFGSSFDGSMVSAPAFFTAGATTLNTLAAGATSYASGLQPIITGGGGSVLLSDGESVGLTSDQITQIQQILGAEGLTPIQIGASTISSAQANLSAGAPGFTSKAATMSAYAAETADKKVDAEQTGTGFTPIISVNITPVHNLNIAIRYEMATKISVVNKTTTDLIIGYTSEGQPITMFPNGAKVRNDMPAMLAVGGEYTFMKLKICLGGDYFFDKSANYGHTINGESVPNSQIIANNGFILEGGLEYNLTKRFLLSAGYNYANKGVNSQYQSDLTYGNATHTIGFGGAYSIGDRIKINAGVNYTSYVDDTISVDNYIGPIDVPSSETLSKSTFLFGIGLDLKL